MDVLLCGTAISVNTVQTIGSENGQSHYWTNLHHTEIFLPEHTDWLLDAMDVLLCVTAISVNTFQTICSGTSCATI